MEPTIGKGAGIDLIWTGAAASKTNETALSAGLGRSKEPAAVSDGLVEAIVADAADKLESEAENNAKTGRTYFKGWVVMIEINILFALLRKAR